MEFFVSDTSGPEQAEIAYTTIRKAVAETTKRELPDRRIYAIYYTHEGMRYQSVIDEIDKQTGEVVVRIFQSKQYYSVCTPFRGMTRGKPL